MSNVLYVDSHYLSHHGVKGQRWGIRRYQNINGTLTAAGRRRVKKAMKLHDKVLAAKGGTGAYKAATKKFTKYSRKLYSGETKELIKQIQKDNELRSVYEYKKSEEGARRLEQGLKYVKEAANILSIGMTAYSTYTMAKANTAKAKFSEASARKTDAEARDKRAEAATKEYELKQKKNGQSKEPDITWYDADSFSPKKSSASSSSSSSGKSSNSSNKSWSYDTAQWTRMKNSSAGKKAQQTVYNIAKDAFTDWSSGTNAYNGGFKKTAMQSLSSGSSSKISYKALPSSQSVLALPSSSLASEFTQKNGKWFKK